MAQPGTDEQLAAQYFQQGDMERALLYYEKLYKQAAHRPLLRAVPTKAMWD